MKTITTPTALLLLAGVAACADTPDGTADSATAPEAAPAPAPTDHAGYVPGNRIDAFAVNCKLCDERARQAKRMSGYLSFIWTASTPNHPMWIEDLMRVAERWEAAKAEHGANSDQALAFRDDLVLLRKVAVGWLEDYEGTMSLGETWRPLGKVRRPFPGWRPDIIDLVPENPALSLAEVVDLVEGILLAHPHG